MSDKMNKELNEAEINQIIDEEIGAYLEENSVGGGAMAFAPGAVKKEIDEAAPGKLPDPVAHKMTPGDPNGYTDKFGRYIPYKLKGCDLELKDVPMTYPPNHKIYWKRDGDKLIPPETDPETGLPVNGPLRVASLYARSQLHKWMCSPANKAAAPWPDIPPKAPSDEFEGTVGSGQPFPRHPGAKMVFPKNEGLEKGISLRVTTPDTLDEV